MTIARSRRARLLALGVVSLAMAVFIPAGNALAQPADADAQAENLSAARAADAATDEPEPNLAAVWLRAQFPASLRRTTFLLADYQWICLLVLIFVGFLVDMVVRYVLGQATAVAARYFRRDELVTPDTTLWRPVGLLANAVVWYVGTAAIGLPTVVSMVLLVGLKLFAVVAAVWTAFIVIDMFIGLLLKKAAKTETKFDDLLIPLVSKSLKALAVCVGVLTGADALNLPLAGLVGGLGIGGLALAMASKDAVSNLFGSFTVLVDRPFEVGDWVITPGAEGTVEAVGFRSTRIRTFYNSQITVPNSLLTTAMVDNMGRRRYRRVKTTLGVQYNTTPAQMDAFCEGVRELIRRNPYTRKDYYHVYFNEFGSSSLDVMLYCFLECPDWAIELRERHRLLLDILRLADRLGVQFAFPTRTMHLFQEDTPSAPPELSDPAAAGKELAAQLASEAASRPGPVEF